MEASATGKDVILDIVENMRQNREELLYSTLVPTRYEVYLHPDDYARLQGILPAIQEQATRALQEEVLRLNAAARRAAGWKKLFSRAQTPSEPAQEGWQISFHGDADEELKQGEIMVVSSLTMPPRHEQAGTRTRRMATSRLGTETKRRAQELDQPGGPDPRAVSATLSYEDTSGRHTYRIEKPVTVIGRGGIGYWVDVKLEAPADVSREHARLRRGEDGRFYIKDMSTFGTTVNGRAIASSVEAAGDEKRDRDIEVPLPPNARIGLADIVYLEFRAGAQDP